jgi:hypothetical protein
MVSYFQKGLQILQKEKGVSIHSKIDQQYTQ